MSKPHPGLLAVHVAVALFGLSGLLGRLIAGPPRMIVFSRALLAALALGAAWVVTGAQPRLTSAQLVRLAGLGVLLAIHWVAFFHAIQISTVAIGLLSYASFPLFTTFLEPWLLGGGLRRRDWFTAGLVTVGLALVVPSYDLSQGLTQGVAWGVFSGFTFALLSVLTRRLVQTMSPLVVAAGENAAAALVLVPFLRMGDWPGSGREVLLLLMLGLVCTALAHGLFIGGLRRVRAQVASVVAGLEPVYGIGFAMLLLGERPSARSLVGGSVIIGASAWASWREPRPGPLNPPTAPGGIPPADGV